MRLLYIALLICIGKCSVFAQTSTILNEGNPGVIKINASNIPTNSVNKNILTILANGNSGDIELIELEFTLKEYHLITQRGTKINLSAALGNIVLQGEHSYKKFPVNHLLMPSQVNFKYNWKTKDGTEIESKFINGQNLKSGADVIKLSKPFSDNATDSKFYLSEVVFVYTQHDLKKLEAYINAINDYYNADAKLDMINQELDKIKTDTLELLDEFYSITLSNSKYFNQLKSQRLNSKLSLTNYDPVHLKSKLGKTEVKNRNIKKDLEYVQNNMHETYYKKGIDWLNWQNEQKAKDFFLLSIQEKNDYAPPYYELSLMEFNNKHFSIVLDSCRSIINTKKPDNDTRFKTLNLAEKVILIYIDSTLALVSNNHYEAALTKLNFCKEYVNSVEGIRKFPEFNDAESKIYSGYYSILAKRAKSSLEKNYLEKAQTDIDSMTSFRQAMQDIYIEKKDEEILLAKLYEAWTIKGKQYLHKEVTDSAAYCLARAKTICSNNDYIVCSENLMELLLKTNELYYSDLLDEAQKAINNQLADSALTLLKTANKQQVEYNLAPSPMFDTLFIQANQILYDGLIKEGDFALNGGDGKKALAYFQEAIEIEESIKINTNKSLQNKSQNAASAYILSICSSCETYIKSLQIDKAQAGLVKTRSIEMQYQLTDRPEVNEAIEKLSNLLNQGQCNLIQHDFNVQVRATKKFIDKRDFSNAINAINNAKKLAKQNDGCEINLSEINKIYSDIHNIAKYTSDLVSIEKNIGKKKFNQSIHEYIALTTYYTDSVIINYDIIHLDLYDYVISHDNNDFINYGVEFYIEQSEIDNSLNLLNELYRRNYISSWSKENQIKLGQYYANRDFNENAETLPKVKVSQYTNDLPWFKYLRQAYLKQWKSLM